MRRGEGISDIRRLALPPVHRHPPYGCPRRVKIPWELDASEEPRTNRFLRRCRLPVICHPIEGELTIAAARPSTVICDVSHVGWVLERLALVAAREGSFGAHPGTNRVKQHSGFEMRGAA